MGTGGRAEPPVSSPLGQSERVDAIEPAQLVPAVAPNTTPPNTGIVDQRPEPTQVSQTVTLTSGDTILPMTRLLEEMRDTMRDVKQILIGTQHSQARVSTGLRLISDGPIHPCESRVCERFVVKKMIIPSTKYTHLSMRKENYR